MQTYHAHADPPLTFSERLGRLKDNLQALGVRLKQSIASVIGTTIAEAIRDAIHKLLGGDDQPTPFEPSYHEQRDRFTPRDRWDDRNSSPWDYDEEPRWNEEEFCTPSQPSPAPRNESPKRWRNALTAGVQTALWWLKHQPMRRPVIATVVVVLAAGVTGYIAGPTVAAGATVLTSIASLLLTSGAIQSAAELASG
jgi:hypothetical protein